MAATHQSQCLSGFCDRGASKLMGSFQTRNVKRRRLGTWILVTFDVKTSMFVVRHGILGGQKPWFNRGSAHSKEHPKKPASCRHYSSSIQHRFRNRPTCSDLSSQFKPRCVTQQLLSSGIPKNNKHFIFPRTWRLHNKTSTFVWVKGMQRCARSGKYEERIWIHLIFMAAVFSCCCVSC